MCCTGREVGWRHSRDCTHTDTETDTDRDRDRETDTDRETERQVKQTRVHGTYVSV